MAKPYARIGAVLWGDPLLQSVGAGAVGLWLVVATARQADLWCVFGRRRRLQRHSRTKR